MGRSFCLGMSIEGHAVVLADAVSYFLSLLALPDPRPRPAVRPFASICYIGTLSFMFTFETHCRKFASSHAKAHPSLLAASIPVTLSRHCVCENVSFRYYTPHHSQPPSPTNHQNNRVCPASLFCATPK